ncbi:hypothetical protein ACSS6W_005773 [Trichoderma asperelloides]
MPPSNEDTAMRNSETDSVQVGDFTQPPDAACENKDQDPEEVEYTRKEHFYRLTLDEKDAFDKMGFISTVEFAPNYRDVYQGIGARNCSPEYDPSRDLMGVIFSQRVCK